MSQTTWTETPEARRWVRAIVEEALQEQRAQLLREVMEGELGRLRLEFRDQMEAVWTAIRELAEAQRRSEERLDRLEQTVAELAEAQRRTEERLNRLEQVVAELAEAQRRSEERLDRLEQTVAELAEAQRRTEERLNRLEQTVAELAEAQRRTEERLNRLEQVVAELAEAQRRTEERLDRMEQHFSARFDHLQRVLSQVSAQVGHLVNLHGAWIEADAEKALPALLEQMGYQVLEHPFPVLTDGELDVVAAVRDPKDPKGTRQWVVVEAKIRVRLYELERWQKRLQDPYLWAALKERGVAPPLLPVLFGLRVYNEVLEEAKQRGIGVITPTEVLVPPRAWSGPEPTAR